MNSSLKFAIQLARTEEFASMGLASAARCTKVNTAKQEVSSEFLLKHYHYFPIVDASGSFSFLMFIFMIGLVIAGILILWQRDKFRDEIREYQERLRNSAGGGSYKSQPNTFNNAEGRPISPR